MGLLRHTLSGAPNVVKRLIDTAPLVLIIGRPCRLPPVKIAARLPIVAVRPKAAAPKRPSLRPVAL